MKIPISKPLFGDEEKKAIAAPLDTGWVVQGPQVQAFEEAFAKFTGAKHALATTSCTTALHLAMVAYGVGPGDEVLVPAFTWVATANVVELQGARPVLVDVETETFNMDLARLERAFTPRTKVVMPVSLFGVSAPMKQIVELARSKGVKVVEDDACATGARYQGKHAGALADAACFSFHPRKAITTGEGGMLTTNDDATAALCRSLRDHGASKSDLQRHLGARSWVLPDFDHVGFNYRMTDFQGALGVVQMTRLEGILAARTRLAKRYDEALSKLGWLRPPVVPQGSAHGLQAYVCLYQPEAITVDKVEALHKRRNDLMDRLEAAGIATRPGTHAVHMLGFYRKKYGIAPRDFPGAYIADQLTITLPLYPQLTEAEQDYVVEQLRKLGP